MSLQKIDAVLRERKGKGPARRLRAKGLVPAVIYGQGVAATQISVNPRALVKALAGPKRTNTLLEISVSGNNDAYTALVRDHQFDPVSRELLHVDFMAVGPEQSVRVDVSLSLIGRAKGQQLGGTISQKLRKVKVECKASDIPEAIKVDVTEMELGQVMTGKDLTMPENVSLLLSPRSPIVEIVAKRVDTSAAAEGEEGAEEKSEG